MCQIFKLCAHKSRDCSFRETCWKHQKNANMQQSPDIKTMISINLAIASLLTMAVAAPHTGDYGKWRRIPFWGVHCRNRLASFWHLAEFPFFRHNYCSHKLQKAISSMKASEMKSSPEGLTCIVLSKLEYNAIIRKQIFIALVRRQTGIKLHSSGPAKHYYSQFRKRYSWHYVCPFVNECTFFWCHPMGRYLPSHIPTPDSVCPQHCIVNAIIHQAIYGSAQ